MWTVHIIKLAISNFVHVKRSYKTLNCTSIRIYRDFKCYLCDLNTIHEVFMCIYCRYKSIVMRGNEEYRYSVIKSTNQ
jgi:hypothetical protein